MSTPPPKEERETTWAWIEEHYTRRQVSMLCRYSKTGMAGFRVVRSAEAPTARQLVDDLSRFHPKSERPS